MHGPKPQMLRKTAIQGVLLFQSHPSSRKTCQSMRPDQAPCKYEEQQNIARSLADLQCLQTSSTQIASAIFMTIHDIFLGRPCFDQSSHSTVRTHANPAKTEVTRSSNPRQKAEVCNPPRRSLQPTLHPGTVNKQAFVGRAICSLQATPQRWASEHCQARDDSAQLP